MKNVLLILISLLLSLAAGCSDSSQTAAGTAAGGDGLVQVRGQVIVPLEKANLYIYKKGMDLYGPAFAVSEETDLQGRFSLALPEGDYVAVVRKRSSGATVGPVVAGDNRSDFLQLKVRGGMAELGHVYRP